MVNRAREASSQGKKQYLHRIIILLLIFLLILAGFLHFWARSRPQIEMVNYGEVVDQYQGTAVLIRQEETFDSGKSGEVELVQAEGDRVPQGEKVAQLFDQENNQIPIYTESSGLISYAYDGYENVLTTDIIEELTYTKLADIDPGYNHLIDGRRVTSEDFLYRIINNDYIYLAFLLAAEEVERFQPGETVFVSKDYQEELFTGEVLDLNFNGEEDTDKEQAVLVVRVDRFKQRWLNQRMVEKKLIKNIYRGLVVPREAIFLTSEGRGVLRQNQEGDYDFTTVEIIGGNREEVVVEGLEVGQRILINPESIDYGRGG